MCRDAELAVCIDRSRASHALLAAAADCAVTTGRPLRILHVVDPAHTRELRARNPKLHFRDDSYVRSVAADLASSCRELGPVAAEVLYGSVRDDAIAAFLDAHPETRLFAPAADPLVSDPAGPATRARCRCRPRPS